MHVTPSPDQLIVTDTQAKSRERSEVKKWGEGTVCFLEREDSTDDFKRLPVTCPGDFLLVAKSCMQFMYLKRLSSLSQTA